MNILSWILLFVRFREKANYFIYIYIKKFKSNKYKHFIFLKIIKLIILFIDNEKFYSQSTQFIFLYLNSKLFMSVKRVRTDYSNHILNIIILILFIHNFFLNYKDN